jgi:hypothetical protein
MTFGDLPVVGVLLSDDFGVYHYGAGYVIVDGGGVTCPTNTANISVQGFDLTPYNGWNGIYTGFECGPLGCWPTRPAHVSTLCVTPR